MGEINYNDLVNMYYENNTNCNKLKKLVDTESKQIKEYLLNTAENRTITTDLGIVANISESVKETLDEDKLIEFLEPLEIPGLIEIKKTINLNVLEDAIYHNNIDPKDLAPFRHKSISYRLNCKMKK